MLFATPQLDDRELEVIVSIDETRERLRFMLREPHRWYGPLRRTALARNVQASNSIEGHNVSRDDAAAAIDGGEPLEASDEDWNAVHNYWDAMTYIIQLADDPHFEYSEALVRSLHFVMMRHDLTAMPGLYRPGGVFVWSTGERDVVYEGPDPDEVPALVEELAVELNEDAGGSPAMVRAAMAHLNLVLVHPFKDGNGRMARALQTLVLARERILAPQFSSIEEYLGRNTPAYYDVLAEVGGGQWNPARDPRPWIRFALVAHYRQAHTLGRRIRESERLWEAIDGERQRTGLDERTMGSLYNAAVGLRVRRPDHIEYSDVSERVATSDLKRLVDAGLLRAVGDRRGRYYLASDRLHNLNRRIREERKPIPDPFEATA
jgi:Fic family protein